MQQPLPLEDLKPYYTIPDAKIWPVFMLNVSHTYTDVGTLEAPRATPVTRESALFHIHQAAAQSKPAPKPPNFLWDQIVPGLYLGQLPTISATDNHAIKIKELADNYDPNYPLGLVVSALDYFEIVSLWAKDAVTPRVWQDLKVKHIHLRMTDFDSDSAMGIILQTLVTMKKHIDMGQAVYVHCKAGKGRSALLILAYLMVFGNGHRLVPYTSFKDALEFLKTMRQQINMNENQLLMAQEIAKQAFKLDLAKTYSTFSWTGDNKVSDIDNYLASMSGKDDIRHLTSFKELAVYASKNLKFLRSCYRSNHIRELFSEIYTARDAQWFRKVLNNEGALKSLLDANPHNAAVQDRNERIELVKLFKEEMVGLIAKKLAIGPDEVDQIILRHPRSPATI